MKEAQWRIRELQTEINNWQKKLDDENKALSEPTLTDGNKQKLNSRISELETRIKSLVDEKIKKEAYVAARGGLFQV